MPPQNNPDRIRILFDDHRLVANAGLLLPATLARHLGLRELVDHHLDLGGAPGRANTGDKMLTLVASALAGGDCIDDADALRAGGTVGVLGCVVKAPSTLGTFLRSFRWGHVRQLDRVSRQVLARAWAAGAGPGDSPLTIDLDCRSALGPPPNGQRWRGRRGGMGALAERDPVGDVGGRAAAAPAPKAALGLGPGQVVPPGVVLLPGHLGVDALMGDDPSPLVQRETPGHLRRRPARAQTGENLLPQRTVPLQPGAPPTTGVGLLVCVAGLVAQGAGAVALQLPSHRRWRAIHTCCDLPERGALGT